MACDDCKDREWCVTFGAPGDWCENMWKLEPIEPTRFQIAIENLKVYPRRIKNRLRGVDPRYDDIPF